MKKLKRGIVIILILLLSIILTGCGEKKMENTNNESNTPVTTNSVSGENEKETTANVYVGMKEEFKKYEIKLNSDLSVIEQAQELINKIGEIIGYKIEVNEITSGKGGMTIDFKTTSAPFDDNSYIGGGDEEYHIFDYDSLVYTMFDSIQTTLQKYFGETMDVWYSVDNGKEIKLEKLSPVLELPITEPYKGSKNYTNS